MNDFHIFQSKVKVLIQSLVRNFEYLSLPDLPITHIDESNSNEALKRSKSAIPVDAFYTVHFLEKQLKLFEVMYFTTCSLRNTLSGAIDSLQIVTQLKNKSFLDEWTDNTVYNSTAVFNDDGILSINIPEDLPKYSREMNLAYKKRWQGYIYSSLKRLKAQNIKIPCYNQAIVAIEIHSPAGAKDSFKWDTSNRAYNLIINSLKGLAFPDDNANNLVFLVCGVFDEQRYTNIYIGDFATHSNSILQKLHNPSR